MDEMNALERQIGRVARQQVGPLAPSDAAVVARGAITPAARWQVGGLFRFAGAAIAGVTILLVGVFVVVALLATDDGAERLPAVGAPASASPEAATADPSLSPTLPASILPPDRSGGFGSASPVWVMDIVEGSSGGNSQIDWYEPEGVIARRLYTTTCQPRCDVGSVPRIQPANAS